MPDRKRSLAYLGAGLLVGIGVSVIILFGFSRDGSFASAAGQPVVGELAPDFELNTPAGDTIRLSAYRGKPVLINFWATWCTPCEIEMPLIQERYEKYNSELVVLGVNFAEPAAAVQVFAVQNELTFPLLLDPAGSVTELYHVRNFPTTYFIDRDGIIRSVHIGLLSDSLLNAGLEKAGLRND